MGDIIAMKKISGQIIKCMCVSLACVITMTACENSKNTTSDNMAEDKYALSYNFDSTFTSENSMSKCNDFAYLAPITGGLFEYDTVENKTVELPQIPQDNGDLHFGVINDAQLYDGQIFTSVYYMSNSDNGGNPTKFMLLNPNTGDSKELYSVEEKYSACRAVISDDGNIFYTANLFGDNNQKNPPEHTDEKGYDISYSLVKYDTNTKKETTLVNGVNFYYLTGDRIYFDRISNKNNSVHLYYTTYDDAENGKEPIDTGLDVGQHYLGYMWTVKDGIVYYACDDNKLSSYDTNTKEKADVFSSDSGIRTFGFWKDKIVFCSRYQDENNIYRSQISIYDTKTKEEKRVSTEVLNDDKDYDEKTSERPNGFIVSDDLDYFIMEVHSVLTTGSKYYKVYEDGTKEEFFESKWEEEILE